MIVSPWIFTALAVLLTAAGHIFYKQYISTKRFKFLVLTAITFIAIPGVCFLALRELTIAQVYLCTAIVPILTTLGARRYLSEAITKHHVIGLALITSGTVLYLYNSL